MEILTKEEIKTLVESVLKESKPSLKLIKCEPTKDQSPKQKKCAEGIYDFQKCRDFYDDYGII